MPTFKKKNVKTPKKAKAPIPPMPENPPDKTIDDIPLPKNPPDKTDADVPMPPNPPERAR